MRLSKVKLEIAMANATMSAYDVAKKAGISYQTVRKSCIMNIKPVTAGRIANALEIKVTDLIEEA